MNGLTAAKGLRRSVEDAGGMMRISVPALGDAFGRGRLTRRARAGMEHVLRGAGVEVTPGLNDPAGDGWVTLRVAPPGSMPRPALSGPASERRFLRRHRAGTVAAAVAFVVPAVLAMAVALPDSGTRPGQANAAPAGTSPAPSPVSLAQQADSAVLAGDYAGAVRLTAAADPAQVPSMRKRIAGVLAAQAERALRERAFVRAIKLARRAARYGPAAGLSEIVRVARAGLDERRKDQRAAARKARGGAAARPPTTGGG